MQVEVPDSPTEVADDSSGDEPKIEKRKREETKAAEVRRSGGADHPIPDSGEDEFDSPTKRASRGSEPPLSARELRELLRDHRRDMTEAWKTVENRLGKLEQQSHKQVGEIASIAGRTKVNEKDVANIKKNVDANKKAVEVNEKKVDQLSEDVKKLKVQLEEGHTKPRPAEGVTAAVDPWGEYLKQQGSGNQAWLSPSLRATGRNATHDAGPGSGDHGGDLKHGAAEQGDTLTEDDKKTLIIGGWMQDTRRATIEEEALLLLSHADIIPLLDVDKITVFGPRRSVGMIKFVQREGEKSLEDVKQRMWQVVRTAAKLKIQVPSSRAAGEDKLMWASFVKTRTARVRSSHISMIRRVTIDLASDAKDEGGGVLNVMHTLPTSYDMDWNAGTLWCGVLKLGSATHRKPKEANTILMTGGWVNLDAVGLVAGCTDEVAKAAFEREL